MAAQLTNYPEVDQVLAALVGGVQSILADHLVGVYLYGSLVAGGFDLAVSDLDLLVVSTTPLATTAFAALDALHGQVVAAAPSWHNRIEIAYLTTTALKTYRTSASQIAIISPGEPFHYKLAGADWLINWWNVRRQGQVLFGVPPTTLIDPISTSEFLAAVRTQVQSWQSWVEQMIGRKQQAYAVLTLCRAWYALQHARQVSKQAAAAWAMATAPQWAACISQALYWRMAPSDTGVDHAASFAETVAFVRFVGGVCAQMGTEE